ncbi:hypothetical protein Hanom_Chr14g01259061 [Helianthus anomalus]
MYFTIHQISPHLTFFRPRKELCKRNHSRIGYFIKNETRASRDCKYIDHLKPNPVPSPYHAILVQVRSIYLGSYAKNRKST